MINVLSFLVLCGLATGYGVYVAIREALAALGWRAEETGFAVQDFGKVGGSVAEFLWRDGGRILAVSDALGGIYHQAGLDIGRLLKSNSGNGTNVWISQFTRGVKASWRHPPA